jgi:hypothetical protein
MAHRHRPPARSDPRHSPFAGARRQEQALGRFQASGSVGDCAIERAMAGSSIRVAHRRSDMVRSGSNRVLDPLAAWSEQVLMAWRARDNGANGCRMTAGANCWPGKRDRHAPSYLSNRSTLSFSRQSRRFQSSGMRNYRPFADGLVNWSTRPFAALQERPHERAGSARKRTEPERDGCANCGIRIRQQS